MKNFFRNWLGIDELEQKFEDHDHGGGGSVIELASRVPLQFIAVGGEDPEMGENSKVETFGFRVGKLAVLNATYEFGEGSSRGSGDAYVWVPPAEWQPEPFSALFVTGTGQIAGTRSAGLSSRVLAAQFHQIWHEGLRFGVRLYMPTKYHEFDPAGKALVRPTWPSSIKKGDSIRFTIVYWLA